MLAGIGWKPRLSEMKGEKVTLNNTRKDAATIKASRKKR